MGTPKTLDEALAVILGTTNSANIKDHPYLVMKDFLAQRFGTAMLVHSDDEKAVRILATLFKDVTERKA